jgi:integrase
MELEDLNAYESYRNWMNSLPGPFKTQSTKYVWSIKLLKYCEWIGKTPDELIAERKVELKSEDSAVQHRAELNLKKFLRELETQNMAPNTRRIYFTAIRNFYLKNYVPLTFFRREGPPAQTVLEGARAATHMEIKKMLDVANLRQKALVLFIAHTGLSESDVSRLKIGDLGKVVAVKNVAENMEKLEPPIPLEIRRTKTGIKAQTFVSTEAWNLLKTYFEFRKRGTLEQRQSGRGYYARGIPPEKLRDDSPIFRSYGKWGKMRVPIIEPAEPLTPGGINRIIRKIALEAGIWQKGFSAHSLRRFFQTTLEMVGIPQNWVKLMMGHKLQGEEAPYSRPTWEMLESAYTQAEPYLQVTFSQQDIKKLREDLESIKRRQDLNGQLKDQAIMQLENQVKELRGLVSGMAEELKRLQRATTLWKKGEELEKWLGGNEE